MALHQPALVHHPLPKWLEYAGIALVVLALVLGGVLLATRLIPASAPSGMQHMIVYGANGGSIEYMGIPYTGWTRPAWIIRGREGGGIIYTGIPYPAR